MADKPLMAFCSPSKKQSKSKQISRLSGNPEMVSEVSVTPLKVDAEIRL